MKDYIVTTSQNSKQKTFEKAQSFAAENKLLFVKRKTSLKNISLKYNAEGIFVFTNAELYYWYNETEIRFHPNMSKLRILALQRGKPDRMVKAMGLKPKDKVLDCTMGLGADAIVSSHVVGQGGIVYGLESQWEIATLTKAGFLDYAEQEASCSEKEALFRIKILHQRYEKFLINARENYFDVVYFDPMFRDTIHDSYGIDGIRLLSNQSPLSKEAVANAVRAAKRRVVLKERTNSPEFSRLGFTPLKVGRGIKTQFGVIEKREGFLNGQNSSCHHRAYSVR